MPDEPTGFGTALRTYWKPGLALGLWVAALTAKGDMTAVIPLLLIGWIFAAVDLGTFAAWRPSHRLCGVILLAAVFAGTGWYIRWTHPEIQADPHLEATLVIDSLNPNEPNFHIELENAEGPQVTVLEYAYKNPDFNDERTLPEDMQPSIPKAGKIMLPGYFYSGIAKSPVALDVDIAYEITNKKESPFHSKYRFFVDHEVKLPERFSAVNWQDSPGTLDLHQASKDDILTGLHRPIGAINFVFDEKQPSGLPNVINVGTQYRRLTVDPKTMMVRFMSQFPPTTTSKSIELSLHPNAKAKHMLIATWDDTKQAISLMVDGEDVTK